LPIYGYRCQSCRREFEIQQRMSDPPQAGCPDCGGPGTRLFYPTGILFKGSGFYKTDSRSTAASSTSAADAPTPSSDGAAEPAKTTKPAKDTTATPPAPGATGSPKPKAAATD
jgi:putative FmdB family regulatory protein